MDQRNFDALNALAIGYFELNFRAEAERGRGFDFLSGSFRTAKLLAIRLAPRVVGLPRRLVNHVEVRRLQLLVAAVLRAQAAFEDAVDDQGAFRREGRHTGGQHLVDLGYQAGGVGHVRRR